ncbi:MAG: UbiD family decarboxylase domain-containing protein, partial [Candidatus Thermoplasmatota archaeon]|nr:UbiD family decarboxylase domain-containing protein [Candidatus Thermoplasmatota archaeon]MEC7639880.1 UbiD family decarboxylase domain-containing protein [Candidatus Thermoplasmatota archaeon]
MAWTSLGRYLDSLERDGDLLRITRPVDVELEAGGIADLLVKTSGPAVLFEKPRLPDGTISDVPLVMNIFGSKERTMKALGARGKTEIGDRLVSLMKPDIGAYMKAPWKGIPLLRDALALPPRVVRRAACHQIIDLDPDVTKLPIPKCWPMDGGRYITLPLVVTRDPISREHNMGMYRGQVHSEREIGLHWQIHKHGADHASLHPEGRMPVAICIGG